jgi:outer membrane immunogenic protein
MRRLAFAIAATALAFITPARSADLALKAPPPPPPPVFSWTGFYIGAHGGIGGDRFHYPFAAPGIPLSGEFGITSSGGFAGGQVGFNYQITPSFLIGIEADASWSDISGELTGTVTAPGGTLSFAAGTDLNWFGTVRGRIGWIATPTFLVYATGGWAFGETTSFFNATGFGGGGGGGATSVSTTLDKSGWTVGGGFEYAFNNWISLKTEYLFLDLGSDRLFTGTGPAGFRIDEETKVHTIKVGLNLRLSPLFGGRF